jgi:dihydrofolate synthase/folylpolyglutamate synthase
MQMPHWPVHPWQNRIKYDLDNISHLLESLGNPHLRLPPVIHIAGTNGKGSSVAILRSIFESANYKVHTYTSPHLLEFNERIVLAGEKISDPYLYDICERTRLACNDFLIEPTFFEGTTGAAFLAFSEVVADILILETGIGGRLDATNVVPRPLITLITPISFDHMDYLGSTLPQIASEKAGIIKNNVPCVISCQTEEVYQTLIDKCNEMDSPAFCYEYDFGINKIDDGFIYSSKTFNYTFPLPSLRGDHQLINAASAVAVISLINKQFGINNYHIEEGLKKAQWSARIQKINSKKYSHLAGDHVDIWLDGAHNSSGAQVFSNWVIDNLDAPIYLILGMTKNRNIEEFCSYFQPFVIKGYGVRVLSEVQSYNAETISERAKSCNIDFSPADSLEDAIREINNHTKNYKKINILITGSLFLASDFLKLIY